MQSSLATVRAQHKKGSAPSESTPSSKSAPTTNSKSNNAHSKPNPKSFSVADGRPAPPPIDKHASRPKEFARTSSAAPRRLKDIAQAPPQLSSFARKKTANAILSLSGNNKTTRTPAGESSILSPAQQLAMAAARKDTVRPTHSYWP
jgi:hypothetical protein